MLTKTVFWLVDLRISANHNAHGELIILHSALAKHPWVPCFIFCDWFERRRVCMTEAIVCCVLCYSDIPSSHSPVASLHWRSATHFYATLLRHGSAICSSVLLDFPRTTNCSWHRLFLLASIAWRRLGTGTCTWIFLMVLSL